jgi:hypothetical protein
MSVEFSLTNLIFIVLAGVSGIWALMKIIAVQERAFQRAQFVAQEAASRAHYLALNTRLDLLDAAVKTDAGQWQRVERELLNLKAELPLHYVRREDYIQAIATIMTKLDAMALRFENILLKGENRERR